MNNVNLNEASQPRSLRVFFATEMWERYGFYVVQSLLALYLALHFKWDDKDVYALVGSFTAMTYLSPIIGGWIADHLLGQKRTILVGAVCLFFSYLSLTIARSDLHLIASLSGVAVGTGLLKPNISSLLGNEYPVDSPNREWGFTIFYMGITTGIILGTTLPSVLNRHFGWSTSFASAAFGMIIAFLVFFHGIKRHHIADYHPQTFTSLKLIKAVLMIVGLWFISFFILDFPQLANWAFGFVVLLAVAYLLNTVRHEKPEQGRQTLVIGLLCIISIMFWAFYFQMFMSLTLFIVRAVEPNLWGIPFPPPYYVTIQSIGMLIFGYFIAKNKKNLSVGESGIRTGNKFLLAMVFMVLAYAFIVLVTLMNPGNALLSPLLLVLPFLLISVAELLLSPVGLAAITTLASRLRVSTMMGIFFVSLGIGGFLSGKIAAITAITPDVVSLVDVKAFYSHAFNQLLAIIFLATLLCIGLNACIKKLLLKH